MADSASPKVSIIMPLYREWHFLDQAIASVKAQTYPNFECLCLDDGSPNEMPEKAKALTADDPRFRVITFENAGVAATRNRGLDLIQGDFVTFLDQDDCYHPRFLEEMLSALQIHQADCAVCAFRKISGDDNFSHLQALPLDKKPIQEESNPLHWALTIHQDIYNVWQKLYRRDSLCGLRFDPELLGSDDFLFTCASFARLNKVLFLPTELYFYRKHATAVSRKRPLGFAFAQLNLLVKLAKLIPKQERRSFRALAYQKIFAVLRDYHLQPYSRGEHRELALAIRDSLKKLGLSPWRWSLRKHFFYLRYWWFQR